MDCSVPASAITSLNGVRVLSMWWVILGHTYLWLILYRIVSKFDFNQFALCFKVVQFSLEKSFIYTTNTGSPTVIFPLVLLFSHLTINRLSKRGLFMRESYSSYIQSKQLKQLHLHGNCQMLHTVFSHHFFHHSVFFFNHLIIQKEMH